MPLARIITEHFDESLELAMQLRARGFQVETVSPNRVPENPADLEVQLDECDMDDVLTRVMSASAEGEPYVFLAPGSLDPSHSSQPANFQTDGLRLYFPENSEPAVRAGIGDGQSSGAMIASIEPASAGVTQGLFEDTEPEEISGVRIFEDVTDAESPSMSPPAEILIAPEADAITASVHHPVPSFEPARGAGSGSKRADAMFWRVAVVAAALAAAVVVVGSVWQQRRPAPSRLPAALGSQQIPFQKTRKASEPSAAVATERAKSVVGQAPAPPPALGSAQAPPVQTPIPVPAAPPVQAQSKPPVLPTPAPPEVKPPAQHKPPANITRSTATASKKHSPKKARVASTPAPASKDHAGYIAEDTVTYFGPRAGAPARALDPNAKRSSKIQ